MMIAAIFLGHLKLILVNPFMPLVSFYIPLERVFRVYRKGPET